MTGRPKRAVLNELEETIAKALAAGPLDFREAARVAGDAGGAARALGRLETLGLAVRDREVWTRPARTAPRTARAPSSGPVCRRCRLPLTEANWWPSYRKARNRLCRDCSSKRPPGPKRAERRAAAAAGAATRRALRLLVGLRAVRNGLDREIGALERAIRAGEAQDEPADA